MLLPTCTTTTIAKTDRTSLLISRSAAEWFSVRRKWTRWYFKRLAWIWMLRIKSWNVSHQEFRNSQFVCSDTSDNAFCEFVTSIVAVMRRVTLFEEHF